MTSSTSPVTGRAAAMLGAGALTAATVLLAPGATASAPEPVNGKIAFVSTRDSGGPEGSGNPEIFVMDADGTDQTRLTVDSAYDEFPAFSPDGTRIAFASVRDGDSEIYVMDADGTHEVQLTTNEAFDSYAAFSPDGSKIAFTSDRDGNREIYVMDANGSNPTRLTDSAEADFYPVFSPDGTKIAFTVNLGGNPQIGGDNEIYVMDADGTNQARLTQNTGDDDSKPTFSPDGTRIAFSSDRDGTFEIYVMDADGSNPTNLTTNDADDAFPAFSPDGTKIAFTSNRDLNAQIYVMNADGTNQTNVTNTDAGDGAPSWGGVPAVVPTPYFLGFQSPLPKATVKKGSTLPVKFQLGTQDADTRYTDVTDVRVTTTPGATSAPCTYNLVIAAYQCDLKLPRTAGTYTITIERQGTSGWAPVTDADGLIGNGNALSIRLR